MPSLVMAYPQANILYLARGTLSFSLNLLIYFVAFAPSTGAYRMSERFQFVYHAHIADYLLGVTRTAPSAGDCKGLSLFLVERKSPEITCSPLSPLAGNYLINEVTFENGFSCLAPIGIQTQFARGSKAANPVNFIHGTQLHRHLEVYVPC